jgi:AraC family transcriptional regulator, transcriptional activator of pobA
LIINEIIKRFAVKKRQNTEGAKIPQKIRYCAKIYCKNIKQPAMLATSPKAFEYHNFLRDVLRTSDSRSYFMATEENFLNRSTPHFPYRNYFYGIGLSLEGKRRIQVGVDTYDYAEGSLLVIGPGIIRQWLDKNDALNSEALFFTPELFKSPINPHFLSDLPLFKTGIQHVLPLSETDFEATHRIFDLLRQYKNEEKIVASLALSLIEMTAQFQPKTTQLEGNKDSRSLHISRQFDALLQKHYLENKDVVFYAEKLNLTPNHLSETIKTATGKSAKKRIEDVLIMEAKCLLKQTDMTIKEITYWLGFEDPSYFIKFFKNAENSTPNAYRINNP